MAIIVLRAWYLDTVLAASQVQTAEPDLRLSRTGLLKTGMRADFLDDVERVKRSRWFERYLEGELIEFYIEGSGAYSISNLDLISREMYFNKRATLVHRTPTLFFCGQTIYPESSQMIADALAQIVDTVNRKHDPIVPLELEQSMEVAQGVAIDAALIRKIKQSLIVVADVTPIAVLEDPFPYPLPSPQVSLEIGYALQTKDPEDIMLVQLQRGQRNGRVPFEIESSPYVTAKDQKHIQSQLLPQVLRQLQRANVVAV